MLLAFEDQNYCQKSQVGWKPLFYLSASVSHDPRVVALADMRNCY